MESLVTSALLAVAIVFPILATLAVGLRFYAHRLMSQKLQAHDWTVAVALVRGVSICLIFRRERLNLNSSCAGPFPLIHL